MNAIKNFLEDKHITITHLFNGYRINRDWKDKYLRPTYQMYINGKSLGLFWGAAKDYEPKTDIYLDIVFSIVSDCLCYLDCGNYDDFCTEFGFEPEDEKNKKTYKALKKEYQTTHKWLTDNDLYTLQEMLIDEGY